PRARDQPLRSTPAPTGGWSQRIEPPPIPERFTEHRIHDIDFVGTDHIYRLNGTRVEAFSGLERSLYTHLHRGHVNEYRRQVHDLRGQWPPRSTSKYWNTVSVRADGTVLAIRLRDE
ncbi:hypothetical protein ACWELX_14615, partial [Streptomyces tendae]